MTEAKLLITIDTEVGEEGRIYPHAFDRLVLGKVGKRPCGAPAIAELLEEHGFRGEFFVDVYEAEVFGEEPYADLCRDLHGRGHGVQLHTHPSYLGDGRRKNMYQYSLEEQCAIIAQGKAGLTQWIGLAPAAHRAGNYGADNTTLRALALNGIRIDSSFFQGHPNSKITLPGHNMPMEYKGVVEVPVTVYKRRRRPFGIPIPFGEEWAKIDINYLGLFELKEAVMRLRRKLPYVVIFLHSWSFVGWGQGPGGPFWEQRPVLQKFRDFLDFLAAEGLKTASFKAIEAQYAKDAAT